MDFFTKIDIPAADFKIDHESRIAFFGSCFADNISAQFSVRKFHVLANPFGTVYNPLSITRQIRAIADAKVFGDCDVFQDTRSDKLWHSWDAHGSLSGATREECIANLNDAATRARKFLEKADVVFITLGTALVYFLKESGEAVANCHKQDAALFERRPISVEEASRALECITQDLRKIAAPSARNDNSKPHVVFTISPLRHMADGAHGNTLSKATLQLAINEIMNNDSVEYFPSYEIMMDELRDYRFYESDMVHLSKTAEEYIFERMAETYCSETTRDHIRKVERFMKGTSHRMADPDSAASRDFAKKLLAQAAELEAQVPGLDLG